MDAALSYRSMGFADLESYWDAAIASSAPLISMPMLMKKSSNRRTW